METLYPTENLTTTEALVKEPDMQEMYNLAAVELLHNQRTTEDVTEMLVQKGVDTTTANNIVYDVQTQINSAKKERAKKDVLWGGVWFFGGIIVTFLTYSAASGGGSYVVAWGAIVFGGIQFFKGLFNLQS